MGGESYSPKDPAEYDIPTILVKDVTGVQLAMVSCNSAYVTAFVHVQSTHESEMYKRRLLHSG